MSEAVYEGHLETLIKAHIAAVHQEIELAAHLSFCVDGDGHLEGRADQFIFAAHWGIEDVVPGKNVRRQAQLQKCGLMRIEDVVKMLGVDKRTADMGDYDPVVARSTRPYHVKNLRDINNAYLPQPPRVVFGLIIHFYFPTDPRGPSPPIMGDCRTKTVPFYPGRFRWNGPGYIVPPGTMPFFPDWPRWLRSSLTGDGEFERESVEIWFLRYVEAGMFADEVMPLPAGQQGEHGILTVSGLRDWGGELTLLATVLQRTIRLSRDTGDL